MLVVIFTLNRLILIRILIGRCRHRIDHARQGRASCRLPSHQKQTLEGASAAPARSLRPDCTSVRGNCACISVYLCASRCTGEAVHPETGGGEACQVTEWVRMCGDAALGLLFGAIVRAAASRAVCGVCESEKLVCGALIALVNSCAAFNILLVHHDCRIL